MKATGIVRRIDDLGRIVIPKEIRRTLRFRESDPIEIFTGGEGEIVLKKYSPVGELEPFARQYAESLAQTTGNIVCITDKDKVIAVAGGSKKELLGRPISHELEQLIENRERISALAKEQGFIKLTEQNGVEEHFTMQVISSVICQGDAIGAVIITSCEPGVKAGETEQKLALVAAAFLGKQMEA